jgi:hypothetical protein
MPRKSTSSTAAGDTTISMPSNVDGAAGSHLEGDTSMLSVATEASTKPKANSKAPKEDQDSVGVDVCIAKFGFCERVLE